MLRSHLSTMIPPALRRLACQPGEDVLLVCPGIVYRRDAIDWQPTGAPHQLDLWRITRRALRDTDMDQMITGSTGRFIKGPKASGPADRAPRPRDRDYPTGNCPSRPGRAACGWPPRPNFHPVDVVNVKSP
jgi:hypothetical protein